MWSYIFLKVIITDGGIKIDSYFCFECLSVVFNFYNKKNKYCFCFLVNKSCLTLCDLMEHSPPGSSACWIFQARKLEAVVISSPGDFPDPGIEEWKPKKNKYTFLKKTVELWNKCRQKINILIELLLIYELG